MMRYSDVGAVLFLLGHFVLAGGVHPHVAAAVLALRNGSFEIQVLDGVVFGLDREALDAGARGQSLRHRPRFQDAVFFQAKVVVQA
jgi:hypothetical protein